MTEDFIRKVQIFIEKNHMIKKGDRILVGVSGGADSVALLLTLRGLEKRMGFSLAAVHVEHGIRGGESIADADFAEKLCADAGIPFCRFSVEAPGYAGRTHRSLEEAARELRYGCFVRACAEIRADKVAVAHHMNDSAETMLFHLARGTGIRGLGGIAPMLHYHVSGDACGVVASVPVTGHDAGVGIREENLCVIRPFLCVTRAEIEAYLDVCGQTYCTDRTNADLRYARNRIRGRILPELEQVNGQALSHITQAAGRLREIQEYLDETAFFEGANAYEVIYRTWPRQPDADGKEPWDRDMFLQADGTETGGSPIGIIRIFARPFLAMHRVLRATLVHELIEMIAGSGKDITSGHVEQVLELFGMREGKRTDLPYGISAKRCQTGVELYHRKKEVTELRQEFVLDLPVPGMLMLENGCCICAEIMEFDGNFEKIPKKRYTKWMDYDKIKNTVQLRTRRPGDYLQIDVRGGRKKVNRYFIDEKIPVSERERTLLVADQSHILWVIGHRVSEGCKVTEDTKRVVCLRYGRQAED